MRITVLSFSYRHGPPPEADFVFDARFLINPHYVEGLRQHTGRQREVGEYIAADPLFPSFFGQLQALLLPLLPRYKEKGRTALTLAVGCTGGRHRSVCVAERLGEALKGAGYPVQVHHRDMEEVL